MNNPSLSKTGVICIFSLLFIPILALADMKKRASVNAIAIAPDSNLRVSGHDENQPRCFETSVESVGYLSIEISISGIDRVESRLDFLGRICDEPSDCAGGFEYLVRLANSILLEIRAPGSYSFCVTAQDPKLRLESYRLRTDFVTLSAQSVDYLTEEEPDPDPFGSPCAKSLAYLTEEEPDPDPFGSPCTKSSDSLPDFAPGTWPMPRGISELCRSGEVDDHGGTYLCATWLRVTPQGALQPSRFTVAGALRNPSGDDRDFFVFHLPRLATVEVTSTGEVDTFGVLYDRSGHRLATDDDGGHARNFRMVKTLASGWYFVRLEGLNQAEGTYGLSVKTLP